MKEAATAAKDDAADDREKKEEKEPQEEATPAEKSALGDHSYGPDAGIKRDFMARFVGSEFEWSEKTPRKTLPIWVLRAVGGLVLSSILKKVLSRVSVAAQIPIGLGLRTLVKAIPEKQLQGSGLLAIAPQIIRGLALSLVDLFPAQVSVPSWALAQLARMLPGVRMLAVAATILAVLGLPALLLKDFVDAQTPDRPTYLGWKVKHVYKPLATPESVLPENAALLPDDQLLDCRADAMAQVECLHLQTLPCDVAYSRWVWGTKTASEKMPISAELLSQIAIAKNLKLDSDAKSTAARLSSFASSVQPVNISRYEATLGRPIVQNTIRVAYGLHQKMQSARVAPFP